MDFCTMPTQIKISYKQYVSTRELPETHVTRKNQNERQENLMACFANCEANTHK
jgi:hypothetical protein